MFRSFAADFAGGAGFPPDRTCSVETNGGWPNTQPRSRGAQIHIEGELRSREYEADGIRVRTYAIVASAIINLGRAARERFGSRPRGGRRISGLLAA